MPVQGGQGTSARRAASPDLAGETTVEGDAKTATTPSGGIDPNQVGDKDR